VDDVDAEKDLSIQPLAAVLHRIAGR
jgi:hypothetical protein